MSDYVEVELGDRTIPVNEVPNQIAAGLLDDSVLYQYSDGIETALPNREFIWAMFNHEAAIEDGHLQFELRDSAPRTIGGNLGLLARLVNSGEIPLEKLWELGVDGENLEDVFLLPLAATFREVYGGVQQVYSFVNRYVAELTDILSEDWSRLSELQEAKFREVMRRLDGDPGDLSDDREPRGPIQPSDTSSVSVRTT